MSTTKPEYTLVNIKNTQKLLKNINPKRYKQLIQNRYSLILNMVKNHVEKDMPVLDVGTRDAALLDYFKDNGFTDLNCVDICEKSVEIAKNKGYWAKVVDAQDMKFDKKFGLIVMSHVLEHCPDINKVIENAYNSLKVDGILFVEVPRQKQQKVPNKDAHYHFFPSLHHLIEAFDYEQWVLVDSFQNKEKTRLKVVLRKKNGK
jgi:2-polyprenyl-3-methyl-5-hydroxy-6-metoxy-1,4-benzoquinol methylase